MIRVMPRSEGKVLGVQASEKLTDDDYTETFIPALQKMIDEYGGVRVLVYMDDSFTGWEPAALLDDAKFGLKNAKAFEKVAIVGGPDWVGWSVNLFKPFFKGEIRVFDGDELDEAWGWIQ
ncbi:MAG: STAS/SEC14 domain-containing protein [Gammaproteobacteria bacterium]|jgi:hypothetical protein|nr:STAS/SEC14 domain-containing protein [Gammaproteobacteria bacterium]